MAFVQSEFIHDEAPHVAGRELAVQVFQPLLVNGLDRVPVQACQLGNVLDRQQLYQRLDPDANAVGHARSPVQPSDMLGYASIAVVAVQASDWHPQPNPPVQNIPVPDAPPAPFMNQRTGLATTTAKCIGIRAGIENDEQRIIVLFDDGIDKVPFPKMEGTT